MSAFERLIASRSYLPRWLFERAVAGERLEAPTERAAAVLVVDLAGFSALTNRLAAEGRVGPETTMEHLNRWFVSVIEPVQAEGGDVVSFGGDCFTAIFHGGDVGEDLRRAARAAFAIHAATDEPTHVGLAHGTVRLGVAGSEGVRRPYALGEPVWGAAQAMAQADPGTVWVQGDAGGLPVVLREGDLAQVHHRAGDANGRATRTRPADATTVGPLGDRMGSDVVERLRPLLPKALWDDLLLPKVAGEHRVVTTLFLRLVDSADDTAETLSGALSRLRSAGGYVNKIDASEKGIVILTFFGATEALERAPLLAIRAALDLADDGRFAAAITTGRLFVGDLGSTTRHELTAVGVPVNRAARMLGATGDGEVLCDGPTAAEAPDMRFREGPRVVARGFAEPLATIRVDGERSDSSGIASDPVPVFGREAEVRRLLRHLEQPVSPALILQGEMGMGKSRLLREVASRARAGGRRVVSGDFGLRRPFSAFADVADRLGLPPAEGRDTLVQRLVERLENLDRPPVLLLDDAHLAGEDERWIWRALSDALPRLGVPVVIATRDERGLDHEGERIQVAPLPTADSIHLVRHVNPALDVRQALAVAELGEGNPLFLERLARQATTGETDLPATVEAAVQIRFSRLPALARRVLQVGAVWGSVFGPAALRDMIEDAGEKDVTGALGSLVEQGFLLPGDGGRYWFTHEIERAVAYGALPRARTRALHRAALADLSATPGVDPVELLHHARGAGDEDRIASLSVEAAETALMRRAWSLTLEITAEAKDRVREPEHAARLAAAEVQARQLVGQHRDAYERLPHVIRLAESVGLMPLVAKLFMRLAEVSSQLSEYEVSENAVDAGLEAASKAGNAREVTAGLLRVRGWNAWGRGAYPAAGRHLAEALRHAEPDGIAALSARVALTAVRNALGDVKGALCALPLPESVAAVSRAPIFIARAHLAAEQADRETLEANLAWAWEMMEMRQEGRFYADIQSVRAVFLEMTGRWDEAATARAEAAFEMKEAGRRYDALYAMAGDVTAAVCAGRFEEAKGLTTRWRAEAEAVEAADEAARAEVLGHLASALAGDPPPKAILAEPDAVAVHTQRFDLIIAVGALRALLATERGARAAMFGRLLSVCAEREAWAAERFVRLVRWRWSLDEDPVDAGRQWRDLEDRLARWGCPAWTFDGCGSGDGQGPR